MGSLTPTVGTESKVSWAHARSRVADGTPVASLLQPIRATHAGSSLLPFEEVGAVIGAMLLLWIYDRISGGGRAVTT